MSATNNTFDVAEFNRNVQQDIALKKHNNSKPKEDYTGFNHTDFASWAKSSTGKPFNQPQINAEKPKAENPKEDFTGFNHTDFASWAKSSTGKPFNQPQITANKQQHRPANEWFDYNAFVTWAKSPVVQD
jgi:hypothetical protein